MASISGRCRTASGTLRGRRVAMHVRSCRSSRRTVSAESVAGSHDVEPRTVGAFGEDDGATASRTFQEQGEHGGDVDSDSVAGEAPYAYVEVGGILDAHSLRGEVKLLPFTDYSEQRFAVGSTLYVTDNTEMVRNRHKQRRQAEEAAISAAQGKIAADIEAAGAGACVTVERSRSSISGGREVLLVKFRGVNNRTQAAAFKGKTVLIRAEMPQAIDAAGVREENKNNMDDGGRRGDASTTSPDSSLAASGASEADGEGVDEFYAPHLEGIAVVLQHSQEELGTVVDVYGGTGTYDTLKVLLHDQVLESLVRNSESESKSGDEVDEGDEGDEGDFSGGVLYIPFVKDFVPVVDIPGRRCEITPVDGLLELAVTNYASRRDANARRRSGKSRAKL